MSGVDTIRGAAREWRLRNTTLSLHKPILMGILNVTPDSFSDGGRFAQLDAAREHVSLMVRSGVDIIDIGGESTRPGSEPVDAGEEWRRVEPAIRFALDEGALVSIDTSKAVVAEKALALGAHVVNDVTAMSDPRMAEVTAAAKAGVVLMHMKGSPLTMQQQPEYGNVVEDVFGFLDQRLEAAVTSGIPREAVALDPGIGFGKKLEHNLELLNSLGWLVDRGQPVLLGASRKRFIGDLTGVAKPDERLPGTLAAVVHARSLGVQMFRVHDVAAAHQALTVADALQGT